MVISPVYAYTFARQCKVENILKVSLDLTPSPTPSVKFQIMGGKGSLRCKVKTSLGVVNKLLKTMSLLTSPSNNLPCFALSIQVNFPANNLNFRLKWRWSNPGYLLKSFLLYLQNYIWTSNEKPWTNLSF